MESVPSLPVDAPLRAFVIWASAGVLALVVGTVSAGLRRRWSEVKVAATPLVALGLGVAAGHFNAAAHTWATWIAVVVAGWAAYHTSRETSFFLLVGSIGLAGAGLIAQNSLF